MLDHANHAKPLIEPSVPAAASRGARVNRAPGPKLRVSVRVVWYC